MKQIIDAAGNKIAGLFKKEDGSIVVIDKIEYSKKLLEKQKSEEILDLKRRIEMLETLIKTKLNI